MINDFDWSVFDVQDSIVHFLFVTNERRKDRLQLIRSQSTEQLIKIDQTDRNSIFSNTGPNEQQ